MSEFVNPHQIVIPDPYEGSFTCAAPDCRFWSTGASVKRGGVLSSREHIVTVNEFIFKDHANQFLPDRAPDIQVEYELVANCSVCDDGGDMFQDWEGEIGCRDCGTSWDRNGEHGERHEDEEGDGDD